MKPSLLNIFVNRYIEDAKTCSKSEYIFFTHIGAVSIWNADSTVSIKTNWSISNIFDSLFFFLKGHWILYIFYTKLRTHLNSNIVWTHDGQICLYLQFDTFKNFLCTILKTLNPNFPVSKMHVIKRLTGCPGKLMKPLPSFML